MDDTPQTHSNSPGDADIDLREVFSVLWAGKWLIGGIAFGTALISVIIALSLPNIFRAEALLAPNDQGAGGMTALAAQYSGLASLAGLNIGSGTADKTALSLEVLRSRKFAAEFIERHDILVPLVAATGWNPKSGELEIDPKAYNVTTNEWTRDVSPPKSVIPSSQEAYKAFTGLLSVSQDKKTGLITLAIEHYSPLVAKQWVDWLVNDINLTIMRRDVARAEQAIEYLNEQILSTSVAELQKVFFRLIEEQTKTVMLANVSPEYMFRTLDPAIVPELKAKPKRSFIVILATIFGGMMGIVVLIIKNSLTPVRE